MHLGASASSNVCNSYQIKPLTLVHTLSLLFILLTPFFFIPNRTLPALNVTHMAPARLLFLRKIALLTLMLTSPNLSPDADLKCNPIPDSVFNVYSDLNCTRRT